MKTAVLVSILFALSVSAMTNPEHLKRQAASSSATASAASASATVTGSPPPSSGPLIHLAIGPNLMWEQGGRNITGPTLLPPTAGFNTSTLTPPKWVLNINNGTAKAVTNCTAALINSTVLQTADVMFVVQAAGLRAPIAFNGGVKFECTP